MVESMDECREQFEQFARPMVPHWNGYDELLGNYGFTEVQAMWLSWKEAWMSQQKIIDELELHLQRLAEDEAGESI